MTLKHQEADFAHMSERTMKRRLQFSSVFYPTCSFLPDHLLFFPLKASTIIRHFFYLLALGLTDPCDLYMSIINKLYLYFQVY